MPSLISFKSLNRKRLSLSALALLLTCTFDSTPTLAADLASTNTPATPHTGFELPITKGHWKLGGSFSFGTRYLSENSEASRHSWFMLGPEIEYFIADRLSVGAASALYWFRDAHTRSIEPSLTYYFYTQEQWAAFVNARVAFLDSSFGDHTNNWSDTQFKEGVGVSWFFNEHVAFSPTLEFTQTREGDSSAQVKGSFSIFF